MGQAKYFSKVLAGHPAYSQTVISFSKAQVF
jgi:hypothetical protein